MAINLIRRLATGAGIFLVSTGLASAGSVTFTGATTPHSTGIPNTDIFNYGGYFFGLGVEQLLFPQFNNSLGSLTGISITVNGTVGQNSDPQSGANGTASSIGATNTSGSQQTFHAVSTISLYVLDNVAVGGTTCADKIGNGDYTEAGSPCLLGTVNLTYSADHVLQNGESFNDPLNLAVSTTFAPTNFSEFGSTTPGTVGLWVFEEGGATVTNNSGTAVGTVNAFAGASASITYQYADAESGVPEPTTFVLFGSALAGIGLIRRRVRR